MLRGANDEALRDFQRATGVSPVLAQLLLARNVNAEEVEGYLYPTLKRLLPDPFTLKDMERAVARTQASIEAAETIAIFGDYDVDGSCSAALLHGFFTAIGRPPLLYVPDRMREGYGPNGPALLALGQRGASLVITVDCGATAVSALETARAAALDVIVLDHHAADAPVPAFAHVNPSQAGDESGLGHLCAAGIAFLFAVALNRALRTSGWYTEHRIAEPDLRASLDLIGLATICDVVPLKGLNRAFVRAAEARLSKLERPGIRALAGIARVEPPFSSYHCGFVFGPRINAGGRIGRCSLGAELLIAQHDGEAGPLAELLNLHNRERQAIESIIIGEAIDSVALGDDLPFVLASGEGWHPGVVGIVAGRLKERFHKPAFVIGFDGADGRGSARSVPGIDIGAIVRRAREEGILRLGGGHAMAAGFGVSRDGLEAFRTWLGAYFSRLSGPADAAEELWLDALVSPSGATAELALEINRAGPFGAGNAEPVVAANDVRVAFADVVGQGHVRMKLQGADGGALLAIAFRAADTPLGTELLRARGQQLHAAGVLRARQWNGRTEVQLQIEDAARTA